MEEHETTGRDRERAAVDLTAIDVKKARTGSARAIRKTIRGAIRALNSDHSLHPDVADYLIGACKTLAEDAQWANLHAVAEKLPRKNLSDEDKSALLDLLQTVLDATTAAAKKLADKVESEYDQSPSKLFKPNPPSHRYLDLAPKIIEAFGLGPLNRSGGRPSNDRPPSSFFSEYKILQGYGANKTEAQIILQDRIGCTQRTIQNWLREGRRSIIEEKDGLPVLVTYSLKDPECPPERNWIPFEPYLKARLTVAVLHLEATESLPREQAFTRVAETFGLTVEGDAAGSKPVDGSKIVAAAYEECLRDQTGWAGIPLRVAAREIGRIYRKWPNPNEIRELRAYSAKELASPALISSVSRDMDHGFPNPDATQAVAEKCGQDFSRSVIEAFCRERCELKHPLPAFDLEAWKPPK